jgi:hypothetical protein
VRRDGSGADDAVLASWLAALEARHLRDLTFSEVARALRSLSSTYVERRHRIREGAALAGAGKRAAFALFYGPLHYLLVREIAASLPGATRGASDLIDLGCGTGAAGVAWAGQCRVPPRLLGVDRHSWALEEAARTYAAFRLRFRTLRGHAGDVDWPRPPALVVAAFTVNELDDDARDRLLARLVQRARAGDSVLIVEPLAKFVARWWDSWCDAFAHAGGRADQWRFRVELPPIVARLDRAAGLNHREITGRSLWIGASRATPSGDRRASS